MMVPFAPEVRDPDGTWVKVCPECSEHIPVSERKGKPGPRQHGGTEYHDHFVAQHATTEVADGAPALAAAPGSGRGGDRPMTTGMENGR